MMTAPDASFATAEAVERAFYAAFASLDLGTMSQVWSDSEDTACVHPGGGLLQGKAAVMQSWQEIFTGTAPPRIEHRRLGQTLAPSLQVHLVEELIGTGTDRDAAPHRVLATNLYVLEAEGWRLRLHHASLPMLRQQGSLAPQRSLH